MALLYVLFSKFVPIISIWELKVGEHPKLVAEPQETPTKRRRWGGRSHEGRSTGFYASRRRRSAPSTACARPGVAERTSPSSRPSRSRSSSSATAITRLRGSSALAAVGGLVGFVGRWRCDRLTELAWPINVGGMPIVAWWPNLIIIFELTMLGGDPDDGGHAARHRAAAEPRASALRSGSVGRQDSRRRPARGAIERPRRFSAALDAGGALDREDRRRLQRLRGGHR